jgi:Family of unknown function (DUF6335)
MARRKAAATKKKGSTRAKSRARRTARKSAARKKTSAVARARKAASASKARRAIRAGKASRAARKARKASSAGKASGARKAIRATKASRVTRKPSTAARKTAARRAPRAKRPVMLRKPPGLDRERRTVQGDDIVPTPPSSLDLDRTASAARTGRHALRERLDQHTETSPALTAGDVDADWESAYSVGDEAPGGDNPTPDQDVVDDIGRAVGVQYDDNEELKGEAKISKRDKHRWELDPASAEDFNEH